MTMPLATPRQKPDQATARFSRPSGGMAPAAGWWMSLFSPRVALVICMASQKIKK